MSHSLFKRDRVVFISLIDILLQLIFVLMIIILTVFNDYEKTRTSLMELQSANKNVVDLKSRLDQCEVEAGKCRGTLQACIPASNIREKYSIKFKVLDRDTIQFLKFEDAYIDYLKTKGDQRRLSLVSSIEPMKIFSFDEFDKSFIFVREPYCYHQPSIEVLDTMTEALSRPPKTRIWNLFRSLSAS